MGRPKASDGYTQSAIREPMSWRICPICRSKLEERMVELRLRKFSRRVCPQGHYIRQIPATDLEAHR